jgi:hypothetical protein
MLFTALVRLLVRTSASIRIGCSEAVMGSAFHEFATSVPVAVFAIRVPGRPPLSV